ncbi:MAG: HEPN domain-containing protein [Thermoanaerobacteraceae bacterium]|nr:HEPN domain-containing protein [Thermoanaerobacteraceae bacterium]
MSLSTPKAWLEIAYEDLDTAKYMLEGKRYLWTVFLCQQALEKAFKAVYLKKFGRVPPRKHDLVVLAKLTGLLEELDETERDFLRRLTVYYIECRYPEDKAKLAAKCTEKYTRQIVEETERVVRWLADKLK